MPSGDQVSELAQDRVGQQQAMSGYRAHQAQAILGLNLPDTRSVWLGDPSIPYRSSVWGGLRSEP
jgi:hypothetical protein